MTKKLVLNKDLKSNEYYISENDIKLLTLTDNTIKGDDVFEKIYKEFNLENNKFVVSITTKLTDNLDMIIFKQIKHLFEEIKKQINNL
ncbi:MAG: hypothetical protein R3Y64_09450 [Peptostreptococcaceae bacterium]